MPERIQLHRTKGWRKPEGAILVSRPGRWGNPISLLDVGHQYPSLNDRQVAQLTVRDFEVLAERGRLVFPNWLSANGRRGPVEWTYPSLADIRTELAGHDLACWCDPDEPCHADVLLALANQPKEAKRL